MRTRLVRTRRRPKGVFWAMLLLMLSMAGYIRVSMPTLKEIKEKAEVGERVTEEIRIEPIAIHLVSFGGYDVMNSARVEAARYVSRGAAGYILRRDRLYVIGAGYSEREEAEKACVYLAAQEGMACAVIEVKCPEVVMRMTAGRGQIEAFMQAESALRRGAELSGTLSFSLDQGRVTRAQAQEVIKTELSRISAVRSALEMQTGGTANEIFQGMTSLILELEGQMEKMLEEKEAMGLSGRLKYCYADLMVREAEMMNALIR